MIVEKEVYTLTCDRCGKKRYIDTEELERLKKEAPEYIESCSDCLEQYTETGKYEKVLYFVNDDEDTEKSKYFSEFKMDEEIDTEKYPMIAVITCKHSIYSYLGNPIPVPIAKIAAEGVSKMMSTLPVVECPYCKEIHDIKFMRL